MKQPIIVRDVQVPIPHGELFARIWSTHGEGGNLRQETPIVLFHDSLGCVELWRGFPERLGISTGRTVIAYDRLGFGKSSAYRGEWSSGFIHAEAHTFFPLLRQSLGIEKFIALGHSVGGAMAALCAAEFPRECRALITESAQAFVEDRTLQGIREAKAGFQQQGKLDRLEKYHGSKARWVLEAWTETWLSPEFRSWTLDADLPTIVCPTLVLHGENDEYGSDRQPRRIAAAISGAVQLEILPGCQHVPHRAAEDAVVELIIRFLERACRTEQPLVARD